MPSKKRATTKRACRNRPAGTRGDGNGPRFISWIGPLIAGTLIVSLGGFGPAATIIGMLFLLGPIVAVFMPETNGKPLPHALWLEDSGPTASAD